MKYSLQLFNGNFRQFFFWVNVQEPHIEIQAKMFLKSRCVINNCFNELCFERLRKLENF